MNKQIYAVPQLWITDLATDGTFMLMAPSGNTDSGTHFSNGGDDKEGREGDAKWHDYSPWEENH